MATKKAKTSPEAKARFARSMRKYTPAEVEARLKALPPLDQGKFEDVLRRLVSTPPPKARR
jgi:hypothetical protein